MHILSWSIDDDVLIIQCFLILLPAPKKEFPRITDPEPIEEVFETIDLCSQVHSDVDSVSIFQPYNGLPMTNLAKSKGWIKEGGGHNQGWS